MSHDILDIILQDSACSRTMFINMGANPARFAIIFFNVCFELDRVQAYLSMRGGFTSLALYGLGTEEGPQDFGPPGVNGVLGASGAPPGVYAGV